MHRLRRTSGLHLVLMSLIVVPACARTTIPRTAAPAPSAVPAPSSAPGATAAGSSETAQVEAVTPGAATPTATGPIEALTFSSKNVGLAALGVQLFGDGNGGILAEGQGGVARTVDGGVHWSTIWSQPGAAINWVGTAGPLLRALGSVYPVAPGAGTSVSGSPVAVSSADGGTTWSASSVHLPANASDGWPNLRFAFASAAVGFGVPNPDLQEDEQPSFPGVLRTTDGGSDWSVVTLPDGALPSGGVAVVSATRVIVSGAKGNDDELFASDDAGATWSLIPGTTQPFHLWTLDFVDANHGFAGGGGLAKYSFDPDRALLVTSDGGRTWRVRYEANDTPPTDTNGFTELAFSSQLVGVAAVGACVNGQNSPCVGDLYTTKDGGVSWHDTGQRSLAVAQSGPEDLWVDGGPGSNIESSTDGAPPGPQWQYRWGSQPRALRAGRAHCYSRPPRAAS